MARTRRHEPGTHSIDEVTPKKQADGTWVIRWRWWPWDGKEAKAFRHQGRTRGEALSKAREKAAELAEGLGGGRWTRASKMGEYLEEVVRPAIVKTDKLADGSKDLYGRTLTTIGKHLGDMTINTAANHDAVVTAIETIAAEHGAQTGRTAQNVLSRWVFGRMVRSRIIAASPLVEAEIELGSVKTTAKPANNVALNEAAYDRLLAHLLSIDPATEPRKPRSRDSSAEKRQAVIDLTLLQMTTGIRLGSARQVKPHEVIDNAAGGLNVFVPRAKLKGGEARNRRPKTFTVLDERVAERLRQRRDATAEGAYLLGSPQAPQAVWDRRNVTRAIESLYVEMAGALAIKELETEIRSHGWRTTLNSIYYWLPPHVRADWFGHTESVNEAHYLAEQMDISPMVTAARDRRQRVEETAVETGGSVPSNPGSTL